MTQQNSTSNKRLRLSVFVKMSREELQALKQFFQCKSNIGYSHKNRFDHNRFESILSGGSSFLNTFLKIKLETGFVITPSVDLTETTQGLNKIFTFDNIHPLLLKTTSIGFVRQYEKFYQQNELEILRLIERYDLNALGLTKDNFLSWVFFEGGMTLDVPDDERCKIKDLLSQLENSLSENPLFANSNVIIVAEEVRNWSSTLLSYLGCDIVKADIKLANGVLHYHGQEKQKEKQLQIANEAKKLNPIHVRSILGLKDKPQSLADYINAVQLDAEVVQYVINNAKV